MDTRGNRILILADSRGAGLGDKLSELDREYNHWVIIKKGSPTSEIVHRARFEIKAYEPNYVVILTGLCSVTMLHKPSRSVSLRYPSPTTSAAQYEKDMLATDQAIKMLLHPKVVDTIFATITGMNLSVYNMDSAQIPGLVYDQEILDKTVISVNKAIIQRNSEMGLPTPWLHRLVHRYKQGKTSANYYRLAEDGCHLTDPILTYWAKELDVAITKIIGKSHT